MEGCPASFSRRRPRGARRQGGPLNLLRVPDDSGVDHTRGFEPVVRLIAEFLGRKAIPGAQENLKLVDPVLKSTGVLGGPVVLAVDLDVDRVAVRIETGQSGVAGSTAVGAEREPAPALQRYVLIQGGRQPVIGELR